MARKLQPLTQDDLDKIMVMHGQGMFYFDIADKMKKKRGTVYNAIKRNGEVPRTMKKSPRRKKKEEVEQTNGRRKRLNDDSIRLIHTLADQGHSVDKIAELEGISKSSVYKALRSKPKKSGISDLSIIDAACLLETVAREWPKMREAFLKLDAVFNNDG